ncbi:MAG: SpoIVB peptidase S55 domain-containing protein [Candidatus Eiseniibacteriota bacterium]
MSRPVRTASFLPALLAAALSAGAASPVPTLAPDALRPGQKAVVKTVFEGGLVEDFDAVIVAVLKGGRAEGDLILAKATSERVIRSGVAQGMSGSPVYVDGHLIGALSAGWSFSREPLFGVTPIGEMLAVLDHATRSDTLETAGPAGVGAGRGSARFGEFRWEDDPAPREPEPPPVAGAAAESGRALDAATLAVPLLTSGLHPSAQEEARRLLGPLGLAVTPGGGAPDGGPPADSLRPGAAVAVDVLTGDVQMSAIGTLTWRDGDRVLLFGHPLFQSGDVRLPLSTARIATIVASQLTSFKLGVRGRPVGTLTQDRRAAMSGRLGPSPSLLPLTVDVAGPGRPAQRFRFGSIEDRLLAPQLVAIAALNSLLESGGSGANQTVRWRVRLVRRGAPALTLGDVIASDAPAGELAGALAAPLRFLFNNPFGALRLDSVAVAIEAVAERTQWTLRSARLLDTTVRPGGTVRVECDVERWHGGRTRIPLVVAVPEEVPDGRYVLWLGGGPELSRYEAQRLPGRYRPTSLEEAWRRLANLRSGDALYATLFASAPEVTRDGRDYPELPVSALALMAGGQGAGDGGRRGDAALLDERRVAFAGPVRGELLLSVQVDAKAPVEAR